MTQFRRIPLLAVIPELSSDEQPPALILSECDRVRLHHTRPGAREFPAWVWVGERKVLTKNLPGAKVPRAQNTSHLLNEAVSPVTRALGYRLLAAFRKWLFRHNERWLVHGYY